MATIHKESVLTAYEEVRSDKNEKTWFTLKFVGNNIELDESGSDYSDFVSRLNDDERMFGYVRVITGDELSKRSKFVFITWAGQNISPLKKAKLSVDKGIVKQVVKNFAVEILASERSEVSLEAITETVRKAGGANYGTGK